MLCDSLIHVPDLAAQVVNVELCGCRNLHRHAVDLFIGNDAARREKFPPSPLRGFGEAGLAPADEEAHASVALLPRGEERMAGEPAPGRDGEQASGIIDAHLENLSALQRAHARAHLGLNRAAHLAVAFDHGIRPGKAAFASGFGGPGGGHRCRRGRARGRP